MKSHFKYICSLSQKIAVTGVLGLCSVSAIAGGLSTSTPVNALKNSSSLPSMSFEASEAQTSPQALSMVQAMWSLTAGEAIRPSASSKLEFKRMDQSAPGFRIHRNFNGINLNYRF